MGSAVFVNQDYNSAYSRCHNYATLLNQAFVRVVTQQLNDGVRMLQSQAHNKSGVIELCHTSCVRNARNR